ncbi:MAG TPA: LamG domain-containing protein, partial [Roseiflexaceae bacterium]
DDGLGYLAIVDGAGDPRAGYDRLLNLSPKKLDRIYRFLKLARKLGWSFADLDWSLRSLDQPYLPEKALKFDGVNDYVYVACARAPDPATSPTRLDLSNFTIEAWVNPSRAGRNVILSKGDAASGALHFLLWINSSNQLAFYAGQAAGASVAVESVYTIPVGVFTHVAVVADDDIARNGQRAVRLYINGRPDNGIALQSQIAPTGADLNIGRGLYGATAQPDPGALQGVDPEVLRGRYDECFEGIIKEVRVWSSARSQAAIEAGRYQRFTGREIDLAGYWPLTETLGDRLLDLTPNANHGVRGGAQFSPQPAWVRRDLILDPLPAPADGGGLRFNGVDQYLAAYADSAVAPDPANPAQLTVEAWVSIDELRENYIICEGDQESFSDPQPQQRLRFALWIDPSGQLVFQSGSPAQLLRSKRTIGTQTLAHVCVTLDGMSCAMYIDGLLDEAGGGNLAAPLAPPEVDLNVGRSFDGKYFKGLIREVRVWDQARAAEQIAASMYRPIPAGEPGLSGYWRLDTAADGRVADRSSGRRDLYLGGIPEDYMPDRLAVDQILPPTIAVPGMVLQFEGESGVVVIRNANNWGLGKYERLTLELWFRVTDRLTDRKQVIFTQGDSEAGLNIYLAANQVHVLTWNNSYEGDAFQSAMFTSDPISYGAWYHIAVTNNEFPAPAAPADRPLPVGHVELKAYLNGAALKTADGATAAEGFRLSPVGPAYLGGLDKSGVTRFADDYSRPESAQLYFFAGEITDIRLWNVVKTADEIERERIVAPTISDNLVAYFPTDEGGGWLVDDHAGGRLGNPHKGTLKDLNIALTTRTSDSTYADVYSHYTGQGALNWKDYAYSGRMRVDTASAAIGVTFLSRQPDGVDQYYRLGRDAQRPSFHLAAHPQGVQTIKSADSSLDKTDSGVVPQPETWYRFLIAVEDAGTRTNIRAKIWKDEGTGSEPADFQIDAYDDNVDIRITSGTVGVWSAGASAGLRQFDTLRVWPAAIADPTSADLLLDINFEALSQVPEPELWQDTGDRTAAGAGARLFGPIGGSAGAA